VCPVKINIPEVLVHLRQPPSLEKPLMGAVAGVMRRPRLYGFALKSLRILAKPMRPWKVWPLSKWTASRDLPKPEAETFRDWWRKTHGR
jgi:L-lactate dehydrogenase complex protein LldF